LKDLQLSVMEILMVIYHEIHVCKFLKSTAKGNKHFSLSNP
jgi:hypothetical protein